MDDHLVLYEFNSNNVERMTDVIALFRDCLDNLVIRHELPNNNVI